jgi:hypothetical protein
MSRALVTSLLLSTTVLAFGQEAAKPAPAKAKVAAPEDFRFGIHGGLVSGTTKSVKYTTDEKQGFVFGLQGTWDLESFKHRLRARLDFISFPGVTVRTLSGRPGSEDSKVSAVVGGLDYIHFFNDERPEKFYLTGGVVLGNWKQGVSNTYDNTRTGGGFAVGLGWQFNKDFGIEGRATWQRWDTNFMPRTVHNAGTASLEASYRF